MTLQPPPENPYHAAPVIAFERINSDIWKIRNITGNNVKYGILVEPSDKETDLLPHIHAEDQDLVSRKLGAAILQKKDGIELRYRIRAGSYYRWVEEYCFLLYGDTGDPVQALSYLWISSLPVEWSLLCKGSEIWNILNSKIRHDILNQLTAILGYLELSTDLITDPMLIDFTQKEQNAAEKIRDRLIFTREYQKIGLLEFSWVFLSDIIQEALNEIVMEPVEVVIQTGNSQVYVDKNFRLALEKILINIPEHATGATRVQITIESSDIGGKLIIEDNGCGILDQHKTRIFDLGFGKGSGYGLFLAEKILSVFGITIQENGVSGRGARFELGIPSHILEIRS
ncbi:MAG TPA: PAS domain-containing sensor histidine kinase [Methanospirillum sp.]|uniref:sensor histidine kinase n=1 Tax=Methanospirillum sp. TaxID=45200 RepID=UPI002C99ABBF|nr:PAS domain-containing sensor histidine kinase [Methanospirillum sp.]HOJ95417.1 PAS domain-containing sensor histidine kinase [Methanospirillum sp.]HPP77284.1 PAS domain-containing sensor histidine kinase [Methanospirillum sp.]